MNYLYLRGLECCELRDFASFDRLTRLQLPSTSLDLSPEQMQRLRAFHDALFAKLPTCPPLRYVQLHLRDEAEFAPLCSEMIVEASRSELERSLRDRRGVPSFFRSLRPLLVKSQRKVESKPCVQRSFRFSVSSARRT